MSDDDYGEDFDDFDDYGDDDFEEVDDQPTESKQSSTQSAPAIDASKFGSGGGSLNTYEVKLRKQRAKDLRGLVSLSATSQELYSFNKLSPYDYYLRLVKNGTLKQSSQQTKPDCRGVKLQTDTITSKDLACQVPDDLGFSSTNKGVVANAMALNKFLKRAYPVCKTVLEANTPSHDVQFNSTEVGAGTDYSSSHVQIKLPEVCTHIILKCSGLMASNLIQPCFSHISFLSLQLTEKGTR